MEAEEIKMVTLAAILIIVIGLWILFKLFKFWERKQIRYIPNSVKQAVRKRYFNMCAVCPEKLMLEFHHKKPCAEGGENTEENIAPLCSKHHAMVRRLEGDF